MYNLLLHHLDLLLIALSVALDLGTQLLKLDSKIWQGVLNARTKAWRGVYIGSARIPYRRRLSLIRRIIEDPVALKIVIGVRFYQDHGVL